MFGKSKNIKDVSDFNDYASDMFEEFLEGFTEEEGLIRKPEEDEIYEEGWTFIYTNKGQTLAEKYLTRLYTVGAKMFPDDLDYLEISSRLYQEY